VLAIEIVAFGASAAGMNTRRRGAVGTLAIYENQRRDR
jgi:hypothetical protein